MHLHTSNGPYVIQREQGDPSTASVATPTSAHPAPTNSSSTAQGIGVTGSPPLIVAFLAVGLFMAAMLTIFGWRRMVFGRGIVLQPIEREDFLNPMSSYFGEKPELWDLWSRSPVGSKDQLEWERIMVS